MLLILVLSLRSTIQQGALVYHIDTQELVACYVQLQLGDGFLNNEVGTSKRFHCGFVLIAKCLLPTQNDIDHH